MGGNLFKAGGQRWRIYMEALLNRVRRVNFGGESDKGGRMDAVRIRKAYPMVGGGYCGR